MSGRGSLPSGVEARENVLVGDAATTRDIFYVLELAHRIERRVNDVVRVGGADDLRQHVADAGSLDHSAHCTAGDHARTSASWLEDDAGRAVTTDHFVGDRAVDERNLLQCLAGLIVTL